jgi:hypothetical protein
MVLLRQRVHPDSLSVAQQRRVFVLRDTPQMGTKKKLSWTKISERVVNLKGEHPSWKFCSNIYNKLKKTSNKAGIVQYKYAKCGRKSCMTPQLRRWLVSRLLALRTKCICTSTTLQSELARKKAILVATCQIRKILRAAGYKWLRRIKKPKYSVAAMRVRLAFAMRILRMTIKELRAKFNLSLDGVVFITPPKNPTAQENFCHGQTGFVYRKESEAALPELAGHSDCSTKGRTKQYNTTMKYEAVGTLPYQRGDRMTTSHPGLIVEYNDNEHKQNELKTSRIHVQQSPIRISLQVMTTIRSKPRSNAAFLCGAALVPVGSFQ